MPVRVREVGGQGLQVERPPIQMKVVPRISSTGGELFTCSSTLKGGLALRQRGVSRTQVPWQLRPHIGVHLSHARACNLEACALDCGGIRVSHKASCTPRKPNSSTSYSRTKTISRRVIRSPNQYMMSFPIRQNLAGFVFMNSLLELYPPSAGQ